MFRHKKKLKKPEDEKKEVEEVDVKKVPETAGGDNVKDLLEKNLKWSQIIYEQNRKINNKLLWSAIASWLRLFLILAPLVLAILFLPPILKEVWTRFDDISGLISTDNKEQSSSLNNLIKMFNLSSQEIKK